jgi:hypothetical protein
VVVVPNCYLRCRHRCRQLYFDNAVAESFFATYKTPAHGTTSPRSNSTHSCGPKVTTTAGDDTPHPKYLTHLEYELGYRKLTNWRPKPVSIKSGTLHGGIQADGEAPAPRQGTCLTPHTGLALARACGEADDLGKAVRGPLAQIRSVSAIRRGGAP